MKRNIVTQIGSLPYEDVGQALEYSLKHDIPFLPELPKCGDAMLEYIKQPGKLSCLEEFKNQLKKHQFDIVKIQCIGPATLILSGYEEDDAFLRIYNHIDAIMDGLEAKEVILFLDEPALGQAGFDYESSWTTLFQHFKEKFEQNFEVIPGVHTCGNMDWDIMFGSSLQIISFDASKFDLTKYSKYRSGKRIAWGIEKKEDIKDYQEGDLITLPCGIGSPVYKPEDCQPSLQKLQKIAEEIQELL